MSKELNTTSIQTAPAPTNENENAYRYISCLICNKSNFNFNDEKHECEVRKDNPNIIVSNASLD